MADSMVDFCDSFRESKSAAEGLFTMYDLLANALFLTIALGDVPKE